MNRTWSQIHSEPRANAEKMRQKQGGHQAHQGGKKSIFDRQLRQFLMEHIRLMAKKRQVRTWSWKAF